MQNIDPAIIEEFLRRSSESSDTGVTPTVNILPEAFIETLTIGFIALTVIAGLFLLAYLVSLVRKWKVQSAVLGLQKDVSEIKQILGANNTAASPIDSDTKKIA